MNTYPFRVSIQVGLLDAAGGANNSPIEMGVTFSGALLYDFSEFVFFARSERALSLYACEFCM